MCVGDRRPGGERKSRTDRQREGDSQTQKREGERQKGESRGRQTKCDRIERGHTHTHTHTRARFKPIRIKNLGREINYIWHKGRHTYHVLTSVSRSRSSLR